MKELLLSTCIPGFGGFVRSVRDWISTLLMLCVVAGLCGRIFGFDHVHAHGHEKTVSHCCAHASEGGQAQNDSDHPDECPPWPHDHHQHTCCNPAPLAGIEVALSRVLPPAAQWLQWQQVDLSPPEGPVLPLDKPPLV